MASAEEQEEPWTSERFLDSLLAALGGSYRRCADDCFSWLTPFPEAEHERHARVARHGVGRLAELIPGLEVAPPPGGWPAVLFADVETQLAYERLFAGRAREGQAPVAHIISGGCYRSHPVGHLAIPVSDHDRLDAAFAHELVHAVLSPREIPTWFQEGIACEVETRLGNRTDPYTDQRKLELMLAHWRTHDAAGFWSGRAFHDPDSSRHAYVLAQVLVGRWTRGGQELAALCRLESDAWRDQDAALGIGREALLRNVIARSRQRGWLERALYAIFVGDEK
jgi:hypothetical protein